MPGSRLNRPRLAGLFAEFFRLESAGSIVLGAAAIAALAIANSAPSAQFEAFWSLPRGSGALALSWRGWINDGLMALFFFVAGLEIKRELISGELSSVRRAMLPIMAAIGGMAIPAAIYAALNASGPGRAGWGIPMATDIAFSLGVLALLGSRAPLGIKVFLTALAIVDDLGAVLVIAFFYSPGVYLTPLALAALALLAIYLLTRFGVDSPWLFAAIGPVVWFLTHESGIHATLAGVSLAFVVPAKRKRRAEPGDFEGSPIEHLLHRLHPWVTFGVVPLFALANAGVPLAHASLSGPIPLGVALGLFLGKPIGILGFAWLAVKGRFASLPRNVTWFHIAGAGLLAGIGFTMSLFVAELAFGAGERLESAKLGILSASLAAASAGYAVLARAAKPRLSESPSPLESDGENGP